MDSLYEICLKVLYDHPNHYNGTIIPREIVDDYLTFVYLQKSGMRKGYYICHCKFEKMLTILGNDSLYGYNCKDLLNKFRGYELMFDISSLDDALRNHLYVLCDDDYMALSFTGNDLDLPKCDCGLLGFMYNLTPWLVNKGLQYKFLIGPVYSKI